MPTGVIVHSLVAGILASVACGLGVFPLLFRKLDVKKRAGLGYAFAGGLMFSASVYNLILPSLKLENDGSQFTFKAVAVVIAGIILGALFLGLTNTYLSEERLASKKWSRWGGRAELLIFFAMCVHSIPEGVAVGVAYQAGSVQATQLGFSVALAIAIHNIPEGLAVAIPMRAAGASINKCFWAAFLTSLPQPIAAVPAVLLAWLFEPLMPLLMGFAAGAMIFLVVLELIPDALDTEKPVRTAWAFTLGFSGMLLLQVALQGFEHT